MVIIISLLFCTIYHALYGAEPSPINEHNDFLYAALEYGYEQFNRNTILRLRLVSKKLKNILRNEENSYYSIHDEGCKNTAIIKLICSECLEEECRCDPTSSLYSLSFPFPGLFCRTTPDKKYYTAYLTSSHTNKLARAHLYATMFKNILNPQPMSAIPTKYSPEFQGGLSYARTSKPYFIRNSDDICVLEGIPSQHRRMPAENNFFIIPNIYSVFECSLSSSGVCAHREVYFTFCDHRYPFGLLTIFPALYQEYIHQIENGTCAAERDDKVTIFKNSNFHTQYLTEEGSSESLDHIFCILNKRNNMDAHQSLAQILNNWNRDPSLRFLRDPTPHYIYFAMCAKQCGNIQLAMDFLRLYDEVNEQELVPYPHLSTYPLRGSNINYDLEKEKRIYGVILNELTSFATVENVLKTIKARTLLHIAEKSKGLFVKVKKYGDASYKFRPLHISFGVDGGNHSYRYWSRGNKFTLINCSGVLQRTELPKNIHLKHARDLNAIIAVEEREHEGIKKEIYHILHAEQITDANLTAESITNVATLPTQVSSPAQSTALVQRPNNRHFFNLVSTIFRPSDILAGIFYFFRTHNN